MNTYRFIFLLLVSIYLIPVSSSGQILKKLGRVAKEAAKAAVVTDANNTEKPVENSTAENTPPSIVKQKKADKNTNLFDYEKHGIKTSRVGSASLRSGEYFIERYSTVQSQNDHMLTTVVVGIMTRAEQLSELGEGSDKDIAFIYENGSKASETTVGKLDKKLLALNEKYDWYLIKEEAKGGADNKYIKPNINSNGYEISFNGKTYGPFIMVSNLIVDKTGTRFYASVFPSQKDLQNTNAYLLSNEGKLKPIAYGGDLFANIDFSNGCIVVPLVSELSLRMAKEKDESRQASIREQLTDAMINHPDKSNVIFFGGKKLSNVYTSSPWLDKSGNNIFSVNRNGDNGMESGLYLNGKKIADDHPQRGMAWCNENASNWAYWSSIAGDPKRYLIFKDGTKVSQVIHPRHLVINGKNYMVWFTYDPKDSDEIRLCTKEI